ncbi:hypothetical protein HK099_005207 [Clydaea vesicula]|uniref:Uncharacterized protein n=1 Tax=Clydaea vesicula TaxID=447962 RepID=A0AAD5XXQ7_9FUNG|nr:hypothetical protein HK099_005207 [Clydaea vesicula]
MSTQEGVGACTCTCGEIIQQPIFIDALICTDATLSGCSDRFAPLFCSRAVFSSAPLPPLITTTETTAQTTAATPSIKTVTITNSLVQTTEPSFNEITKNNNTVDNANITSSQNNSNFGLFAGVSFFAILILVLILSLLRLKLKKKENLKSKNLDQVINDSMHHYKNSNSSLGKKSTVTPAIIPTANIINRSNFHNSNIQTLGRAPTGPSFHAPRRGVTLMSSNSDSNNRNTLSPTPMETMCRNESYSGVPLLDDRFNFVQQIYDPMYPSNTNFVDQNYMYQNYNQPQYYSQDLNFNPQYFPKEYDPQNDDKYSPKFYVANPTVEEEDK